MKLIVGLGNPGDKYNNTRHNVGFWVLDKLVYRLDSEQWVMNNKFNSLTINHQSSVLYAKPQTFMNNSGKAVKKLVNYYKVGNDGLYIVHDDLDIGLGEYKVQKGKGPHVHYGVNSIEEALGYKNFWRVRIGVENRDPERRISGEEYVLQNFTDSELHIIEGVISRVADELIFLLK